MFGTVTCEPVARFCLGGCGRHGYIRRRLEINANALSHSLMVGDSAIFARRSSSPVVAGDAQGASTPRSPRGSTGTRGHLAGDVAVVLHTEYG